MCRFSEQLPGRSHAARSGKVEAAPAAAAVADGHLALAAALLPAGQASSPRQALRRGRRLPFRGVDSQRGFQALASRMGIPICCLNRVPRGWLVYVHCSSDELAWGCGVVLRVIFADWVMADSMGLRWSGSSGLLVGSCTHTALRDFNMRVRSTLE